MGLQKTKSSYFMVSMKQKKMGKKSILRVVADVAISICLALGLIYVYNLYDNDFFTPKVVAANIAQPKTILYGYDVDSIQYEQQLIKSDQFVGDILQEGGVDYSKIITMEQKAKEVFDVRNIRAGKPYTLVYDSCFDNCLAFIYEPSPFYYINYSFGDSVQVERVDRDYEICHETAAGRIETSLWNAMMDQNLSPSVIDLMEDALASSVDCSGYLSY